MHSYVKLSKKDNGHGLNSLRRIEKELGPFAPEGGVLTTSQFNKRNMHSYVKLFEKDNGHGLNSLRRIEKELGPLAPEGGVLTTS